MQNITNSTQAIARTDNMSKSADPRETQPVAQIETRYRQPDLCTIYQPDADGNSTMSAWITAKEGSFTDLESMR